MHIQDFRPQSYKWPGFAVVMPVEMAQAFNSGKTVQCGLAIAQDGNTTLVRASEGAGWYLMKFRVSGEISLLRGRGEFFLASSGSWSGGSILEGAIALKPGALVRFGAKGDWQYLVCDDQGIRVERHDPRIFEEGSGRWKPLA